MSSSLHLTCQKQVVRTYIFDYLSNEFDARKTKLSSWTYSFVLCLVLFHLINNYQEKSSSLHLTCQKQAVHTYIFAFLSNEFDARKNQIEQLDIFLCSLSRSFSHVSHYLIFELWNSFVVVWLYDFSSNWQQTYFITH